MQIHAHSKRNQMQLTCFTPSHLWPASRESTHTNILVCCFQEIYLGSNKLIIYAPKLRSSLI